MNKTNEQYLLEIRENCLNNASLRATPYQKLFILSEIEKVDTSYKDEDGDWIHDAKDIVAREAFVWLDGENSKFLVDNWFDSIDGFICGFYAKVKLGGVYNLFKPTGEYLFPNWYGDIITFGDSLIYCKRVGKVSYSLSQAYFTVDKSGDDELCDIYDNRGVLLFERVSINGNFQSSSIVLKKENRYNLINNKGKAVLNDWVSEIIVVNDDYAFIRQYDEWHVADSIGTFVSYGKINEIISIEDSYSAWHNSDRAVAAVKSELGLNVLLTRYDDVHHRLSFHLGFDIPIQDIKLLGVGSLCMVKNRNKWDICEWDQQWRRIEKRVELGGFEVVGHRMVLNPSRCFLVEKNDEYNLVNSKGFVLKEWYSEIIDIGELIQVRQDIYDNVISDSLDGKPRILKSVFNLLQSDGSLLFSDWVDDLSVAQAEGISIIDTKPASPMALDRAIENGVTSIDLDSNSIKSRIIGREGRNLRAFEYAAGVELTIDDYSNTIIISTDDPVRREVARRALTILITGGIIHPSHIEEVVKRVNEQLSTEIEASGLGVIVSSANSRIPLSKYDIKVASVRGHLNLYKGKLLCNEWFDAIDFIAGNVFIDGCLKVWKDNKCNLVDKQGVFVSSDWYDDFLLREAQPVTYYSDCLSGAFTVEKDGLINLLYRGNLVFDQWFSDVKPITYNHICEVSVGNKIGRFVFGKGLLGGRLYDSVSIFGDNFLLCVDNGIAWILDPNGTVISTEHFTKMDRFVGDYAKVYSNDSENPQNYKYNFIDKKGHLVSSIWFDCVDGSYSRRRNFSELSDYTIVSKESKYNVVNKDRQLLFSSWYDSIGGIPGKWLISDETKGDYKWNFIDNEGRVLSDHWFKEVYSLRTLNEGLDVVLSKRGYNIINLEGIFTLSFWSENKILDDKNIGLPVIPEGGNNYLFLSRTGKLISPFYGNPDDASKEYCMNDNFMILLLQQANKEASPLKYVCTFDGSLLFYGNYGDLQEFRVPEKKSTYFLVDLVSHASRVQTHEYVIMDMVGNVCTSEAFDDINEFSSDGFAIVKKNGKFNLLDKNLSLVSQVWFDNLGFQYRSREKEYDEYIDDDGSVGTIEHDVDKTRRDTSFQDGYLRVELSGRYNYINESGALKFVQWHDRIRKLNANFDIVCLNNQYNVIDAQGNYFSEDWFDSIKTCMNDGINIVCACKKEDLLKLLIIWRDRINLSTVWFDQAFGYREPGYYPVRLKGKKNFVTDDGSILLPFWCDDQLLFKDRPDSYVVVEDKGLKNIYSCSDSRFLLPEWVQDVIKTRVNWDFKLFDNNGLCCVQTHDGYTYVNREGTFISEEVYDATFGFSNGFAGVVRNNKRNYINTQGDLISPNWYDEISPFTIYKKAVVRVDGVLNVIDTVGKFLLPMDLSNVREIVLDNELYCKIVYEDGTYFGLTKFFVYGNSRIYESESSLNAYLASVSPGTVNPSSCSTNHFQTIKESEGVAHDRKTFCQNNQLSIVAESEEGYYLVNSQGKSNLLDKNNKYALNEWVDSSRILMSQGIVLTLNDDGKWVFFEQ